MNLTIKPGNSLAEHSTFVPLKVVEGILRTLQGEVLTIIEATCPDKVQREATKSLIKKSINSKLDSVRKLSRLEGNVEVAA